MVALRCKSIILGKPEELEETRWFMLSWPGFTGIFLSFYRIAVSRSFELLRVANNYFLISLPWQSLAFDFMKSISCDPMAGHLAYCALYNMGRAYYEGFGVKQSDDEAEKCWLLSARDGSAEGCVKAQSVLGMFYARRGEDNFNLQKVSWLLRDCIFK